MALTIFPFFALLKRGIEYINWVIWLFLENQLGRINFGIEKELAIFFNFDRKEFNFSHTLSRGFKGIKSGLVIFMRFMNETVLYYCCSW